ncbi:MAG: hypothetical protein ACKPJD_39140, partial [Planctomycetaceae bacterium]
MGCGCGGLLVGRVCDFSCCFCGRGRSVWCGGVVLAVSGGGVGGRERQKVPERWSVLGFRFSGELRTGVRG